MSGGAGGAEAPEERWAEIHHRGSLICEARFERDRWLLVKPPAHFLERAPLEVDAKELGSGRAFRAQLESELGLLYVREIEAPPRLDDGRPQIR